MQHFSFLALLAIAMLSVYSIVDTLVAKFQHVLARKKAHIRFLEDRIQAERKSLDEYVADVESKAAAKRTDTK
jgi:hypothetical protein